MRRTFPGLLRLSGADSAEGFRPPLEFLPKLRENGYAGVSFAAVGVDDMQCFFAKHLHQSRREIRLTAESRHYLQIPEHRLPRRFDDER